MSYKFSKRWTTKHSLNYKQEILNLCTKSWYRSSFLHCNLQWQIPFTSNLLLIIKKTRTRFLNFQNSWKCTHEWDTDFANCIINILKLFMAGKGCWLLSSPFLHPPSGVFIWLLGPSHKPIKYHIFKNQDTNNQPFRVLKMTCWKQMYSTQ